MENIVCMLSKLCLMFGYGSLNLVPSDAGWNPSDPEWAGH